MCRPKFEKKHKSDEVIQVFKTTPYRSFILIFYTINKKIQSISTTCIKSLYCHHDYSHKQIIKMHRTFTFSKHMLTVNKYPQYITLIYYMLKKSINFIRSKTLVPCSSLGKTEWKNYDSQSKVKPEMEPVKTLSNFFN